MFEFKNKEQPLPTTRLELLKDTLKYRLFEIILVSIYMFIFILPLIIWFIFIGYSKFNEPNLYNSLLQYGVAIPLIMIFGLGASGAFYLFKKICFQEGESINHDFFLGIKNNYKTFLLIYFFLGLFYMLLHVGLMIVSSSSINEYVKGILDGLLYVAFFFILFVSFFMQTQTIIYSASFLQLFTNSLKFTFGMILKNIVIFITILLPFFVFEFVPFNIAQWISLGVEGIFYFGFSNFVFSLYSNYVFDLTLNKNYPENIRKGLAKENEENNIDNK